MTDTEIGAYEARTKFSQLLDEVLSGHAITILRYGTPVARLTPVTPTVQSHPDDIVEAFKQARKGITLGPNLTIKELIEEGRM